MWFKNQKKIWKKALKIKANARAIQFRYSEYLRFCDEYNTTGREMSWSLLQIYIKALFNNVTNHERRTRFFDRIIEEVIDGAK